MTLRRDVTVDRAHLAVRLHEAVARHAERPALRIREGDHWRVHTFAEFGAAARALAAHLIDHGVRAGDRVAVFSANRPEWSIVDLACLSVRAVPVPVYPTSTPDQVRHILADSGCVWLFCEGRSELERVQLVWGELPDLLRAVTLDDPDEDAPADDRVTSLSALLAQPSDEASAAEVDRRLEEASGDDLASIIYTSGTTGDPRGAMLAHEAFAFEMDALEEFFPLTPDDSSLCFLPLSHALERAWTYYVLVHGCLNTYVRSAATVAEQLVLAKPTLMVSVPRLYEKVIATARERVASSPVKQRIFDWALRVGAACQSAYRAGRRPSLFWRAQLPVADKLVFSSIRDALGGPKTVMACGGAPLRPEVEEFFSACGMLLCQGYGLTEASPLVTFNSPDAFRFGTAGRVVVGGELRIGDEDEIYYRGPNVMRGYWNDPERTAEAIDEDGWLHTGDVGHLDDRGFLVITDRIKDLIVTSNGKNIAPGPIEGILLTDPLFEHAVILGNNRPYLTLLVSPSAPHLEALAKQLQIAWQDRSELLTNQAILDELRGRIREKTAKLAHHEQIGDLRLMLESISMDNGLLTPTLKVKRREVEKRFKALIDEMYVKASRPKQDAVGR
ncbi:AMP-dependent synthetase/ligase [Nigerium massiliense]|uniref:AMP-dependent synthetase/ligase n=1 Tax=Nigerium massiliense TaxID=1522317 RepID=UPI000693E951|nr:long-chain fatty acid--CoA ligase [Nigerium massiliense]